MNNKRIVDQASWPRREHFEFFRTFEHPHFDLTAPLDVTNILAFARNERLSFFKLVLFLSMKTVHAIPEFRWRIEGDHVVEFDRIDASPTYMPKSRHGLYCNMLAPYDDSFQRFSETLSAAMDEQERRPSMEGAGSRLDVVYVSCIPWISFTAMTNPICSVRGDSVPRLAWGKFADENGVMKMPYTVQLHHGLADAYHACLFFSLLQGYLHKPETHIQ